MTDLAPTSHRQPVCCWWWRASDVVCCKCCQQVTRIQPLTDRLSSGRAACCRLSECPLNHVQLLPPPPPRSLRPSNRCATSNVAYYAWIQLQPCNTVHLHARVYSHMHSRPTTRLSLLIAVAFPRWGPEGPALQVP